VFTQTLENKLADCCGAIAKEYFRNARFDRATAGGPEVSL